MRWFRRRGERPGTLRQAASPDRAHLETFAQTHRGVEGYVEPRTAVTDTTMVLIAHDGEWTRRALPSRPVAFDVARSFGIPVYDVNLTGYPKRMREWTARQRRPKDR
jgi:hypothetical protein